MTSVKQTNVLKVSGSGIESKHDLLAVEEPLEIRVAYGPLTMRQRKNVSVTMRTPGHDFELATGFLCTEGIIQQIDQIESVEYFEAGGIQEQHNNIVMVELKPEVKIDLERLQRNFYTTSSCGVCGKTSIDAVRVNCSTANDSFKIKSSVIHSLPEKLRKAQQVFESTGGLHASALFDRAGNLILLREDVGRHNALDKVIGAMIFNKEIPLSNYALVVSGRASFELIQKAAVAGIPLLGAVGAPSSLAVELANETNMTLLGFVRDNRFNIYSGAHRIEN